MAIASSKGIGAFFIKALVPLAKEKARLQRSPPPRLPRGGPQKNYRLSYRLEPPSSSFRSVKEEKKALGKLHWLSYFLNKGLSLPVTLLS
jgi:hypothetical protein